MVQIHFYVINRRKITVKTTLISEMAISHQKLILSNGKYPCKSFNMTLENNWWTAKELDCAKNTPLRFNLQYVITTVYNDCNTWERWHTEIPPKLPEKSSNQMQLWHQSTYLPQGWMYCQETSLLNGNLMSAINMTYSIIYISSKLFGTALHHLRSGPCSSCHFLHSRCTSHIFTWDAFSIAVYDRVSKCLTSKYKPHFSFSAGERRM